MKLFIVLLCLTVAAAAAYAIDLPSLARRERARRSAHAGKPVRSFGEEDLERYRRGRAPDPSPATSPPAPAPPLAAPRDLAREKVHWRKESQQHQRELAKIEANLRRLEWRLNEKRSKRRSRDWLTEDPSIGLLEDSIRALTEERKQVEERFRERARKDGALPGWIR